MKSSIFGLILILLISSMGAAQDLPKAVIIGLKPIAIKTTFNPATQNFEGIGSSEFLVVVTDNGWDHPAGKVSIVRIIEPDGLPKGTLTAGLSRNDFMGPSTSVILTEKIATPLITPSGDYTGSVEITVTNNDF